MGFGRRDSDHRLCRAEQSYLAPKFKNGPQRACRLVTLETVVDEFDVVGFNHQLLVWNAVQLRKSIHVVDDEHGPRMLLQERRVGWRGPRKAKTYDLSRQRRHESGQNVLEPSHGDERCSRTSRARGYSAANLCTRLSVQGQVGWLLKL